MGSSSLYSKWKGVIKQLIRILKEIPEKSHTECITKAAGCYSSVFPSCADCNILIWPLQMQSIVPVRIAGCSWRNPRPVTLLQISSLPQYLLRQSAGQLDNTLCLTAVHPVVILLLQDCIYTRVLSVIYFNYVPTETETTFFLCISQCMVLGLSGISLLSPC